MNFSIAPHSPAKSVSVFSILGLQKAHFGITVTGIASLSTIRVGRSKISQTEAGTTVLHDIFGAEQGLEDNCPLLVAANRPRCVRPVKGLFQEDPSAPLSLTKLVHSGIVLAIPLIKDHSPSHRRDISSGVKGVATTCIIGEEATEQFAETLPVSRDPRRWGVGQVGDHAVGVEDLGHLLLQGGEDRGEDARLEVVQHHQRERVAGQGLEPSLVDTMLFGPSGFKK